LEKYSARISELKSTLSDLLASTPVPLSNILATKPLKFEVEGVYAISTPHDGEIVYVGKTIRKHIVGRLYDHKHMDASSDLNVIVKRFPTYSQEIDSYLVRCFKITDAKARGFFENFAIGVLQPTFNR